MPRSKTEDTTEPEAVATEPEVTQDTTLTDLYAKLAAPFDKTHQRAIPGGVTLEYVTTEQVVSRLNEAAGIGNWEWRAKKESIVEDECIVRGELTLYPWGQNEKYQSVTMTGFGGSRIKRKRADNTPLSIGNDIKAADSDAFKKAAAKFGVALYLSVRSGEGVAELPSYNNTPSYTPPTNGATPKFPTNNSVGGTRTTGKITAKSNNGINVNGEWYNIGTKFPPAEDVLQTFATLQKGQDVTIVHGVGKTFINGLEPVGAGAPPAAAPEEEEEEALAF